jgi:hypothetical protein
MTILELLSAALRDEVVRGLEMRPGFELFVEHEKGYAGALVFQVGPPRDLMNSLWWEPVAEFRWTIDYTADLRETVRTVCVGLVGFEQGNASQYPAWLVMPRY